MKQVYFVPLRAILYEFQQEMPAATSGLKHVLPRRLKHGTFQPVRVQESFGRQQCFVCAVAPAHRTALISIGLRHTRALRVTVTEYWNQQSTRRHTTILKQGCVWKLVKLEAG